MMQQNGLHLGIHSTPLFQTQGVFVDAPRALEVLRVQAGYSSQSDLARASERYAEELGDKSAAFGRGTVSDWESNDPERWTDPTRSNAKRFLCYLDLLKVSPQDFHNLTGLALPGRFSKNFIDKAASDKMLLSLPHVDEDIGEALEFPQKELGGRLPSNCAYINKGQYIIDSAHANPIADYDHIIVDKTFKTANTLLVRIPDTYLITIAPPTNSKIIAGVFYGYSSGIIN